MDSVCSSVVFHGASLRAWGLPLRVIVYRVFGAFSGLRCRLQVLFAFGDVPGRSGRAYVSDSCAETAPQEKKNKCTKTSGNLDISQNSLQLRVLCHS